MTPEQCIALVAADTRVREAARDVVRSCSEDKDWLHTNLIVATAKLAVALAEFDRAEKESK